jgi:hypothetical protein
VVTIGVEHTDTRLAFQARVSSLPDVSGLVADAMHGRRGAHAEYGVAAARPVPALPIEASATSAPTPKALRAKLEHLASAGDHAAAMAVGRALFDALADDAAALNDLAWRMSTEAPFEGNYTELCLPMAERANELARYENWYYVDTLALVMFQKGETREAVRLQRMAVDLAGDDPRGKEARAALQRFEAALKEVAVKGG